jgi:hypothetical protein
MAVRDQTLVVGGDRLLNCNGPRQQARLQELVEKFFGPPYRFQIESSASPAPPNGPLRLSPNPWTCPPSNSRPWKSSGAGG